MTMRVLIVDDEAVARRRIRRLLAAEPDVLTVDECGDGASALDAMTDGNPDVVFLDVQMPELDGFEVIRALGPDGLPPIVFVTAHDRYAVRAFDVHAVDYLLKPFTRERFRRALGRVREAARRTNRDLAVAALIEDLRAGRRYAARVPVRIDDRFVLIELRHVDWIEAADNYVQLHAGSREYLVRETLSALELRLDPQRFVRIHRSTIVRIDAVTELRPASHGDFEVVLRTGARLTLTRTWRQALDRLLHAGGDGC